jgi:hypothetical protein
VLRVSNSSQFTPGQWVRLVLSAPTAGGIVTDMTTGIIPELADYKCVVCVCACVAWAAASVTVAWRGGRATHLTTPACSPSTPPTAPHRNKPNLLSFNSRVSVVGTGFIKLERSLPYNVSTAWKPALHRFERE